MTLLLTRPVIPAQVGMKFLPTRPAHPRAGRDKVSTYSSRHPRAGGDPGGLVSCTAGNLQSQMDCRATLAMTKSFLGGLAYFVNRLVTG